MKKRHNLNLEYGLDLLPLTLTLFSILGQRPQIKDPMSLSLMVYQLEILMSNSKFPDSFSQNNM